MGFGDERHNTRRNVSGDTARRRSGPTQRLGKRQRAILAWLAEEEERILEEGTESQVRQLDRLGIPFNQKKVSNTPEVSDKERAAISRVLKDLQDRGLVVRNGGRQSRRHTRHVRLTALGRSEAKRLIRDGLRTEAQAEAEQRQQSYFDSPTANIASRADMILLEIVRLRMHRYRGRLYNEPSEAYEARQAKYHEKLENAYERLEELAAASQLAVDHATLLLYSEVAQVPSNVGEHFNKAWCVVLDEVDAYKLQVAAELGEDNPDVIRQAILFGPPEDWEVSDT